MTVLHHKVCFPQIATALLLLLLSGTACQSKALPLVVPSVRGQARVQAFSEATKPRSLVATERYLFVATASGLERWDLESKDLLLLSEAHGLPGNLIYAMSYDRGRDWLWIATDGGMTSYELSTSSFSELPAAPKVLNMGGLESSVLTPALDGGVWIGTPSGLFYAQGGGKWTNTGVSAEVQAIYQSGEGTLWIGTKTGLLSVNDFRAAVPRGKEVGCDFVDVHKIVPYSDDTVIVLAESAEGESRVALVSDKECITYRTKKPVQWLDAVHQGGQSYLMNEKGMFKMRAPRAQATEEAALVSGVQTSRSSSIRLAAIDSIVSTTFPRSILLELSELSMPPRVSHIAANSGAIFVATERIGTLHWNSSSPDSAWFRQSQLVASAKQMSVACLSENSCYIAQGTESLWHFSGQEFKELTDERVVHAVIRMQSGRIIGIRDVDRLDEDTGTASLVVSVLTNNEWTDVEALQIEVPGSKAYASSLRESPDGSIWLAIGYEDARGERIGHGIVSVDFSLNTLVYHRASADASKDRAGGILAVPVEVTGIGFVGADDIWLASTQGAARVSNGNVTKYNEGNGLQSELLYSLVCSSGGMVYTASGLGVGAWNGERWHFPKMLKTSVEDLAIGQDGRLWFATSQGLGVYDGKKARRLGTSRGLIENSILDLESDHLGRIWARSENGIALISP